MKPKPLTIVWACILTWLVFIGLVVMGLPNNWFGKLLAVTSTILVSHITYAGYFLLVRLKKLDSITISTVAVVLACILLTPFLLTNYVTLSINYVILFLAAMTLHRHVISLKINNSLDRLARYKIGLEIGIIAFIAVQSLLLWAFDEYQTLIAVMGLTVLVVADCVIIFKHRIYKD